MAHNNKLKLHSTYTIKEITRGKTDKKMHGPYFGKFVELSNAEKKKAKAHTPSGKVIVFTMKPDVHLKKDVVKHREEKEFKNSSDLIV